MTISKLIRVIHTKAYLTEQTQQQTTNNYIPQLYIITNMWIPPPTNGTLEHKLFEFAALLEAKAQQHQPK